MKRLLVLSIVALLALGLIAPDAIASRYKVNKEIREGFREVEREKAEAAIEVLSCKTRKCARREIREGYREVSKERREARKEIRHAIRDERDEDWHGDGGKLIGGLVVGAAVVGIAKAIADND